MIDTLKIFSQKILYGIGMCIAYSNDDLIKIDIRSILNNTLSIYDLNIKK